MTCFIGRKLFACSSGLLNLLLMQQLNMLLRVLATHENSSSPLAESEHQCYTHTHTHTLNVVVCLVVIFRLLLCVFVVSVCHCCSVFCVSLLTFGRRRLRPTPSRLIHPQH